MDQKDDDDELAIYKCFAEVSLVDAQTRLVDARTREHQAIAAKEFFKV